MTLCNAGRHSESFDEESSDFLYQYFHAGVHLFDFVAEHVVQNFVSLVRGFYFRN